LKFVIDLIKKFNIKNIDFLVCNGLGYSDWVKYFDIITKETQVVVGASNDLTGNIKYGGDWILESTNEDIKNIYWDELVSNYTTTLATGTITVSQTVTNADLNDITKYTWPITINGGTQSNPTVVTFDDNIILNSVSKYFIIGSEYIVIEGNYKTVTVDGVSNYPGLFLNGLQNSPGYSNVLIQNINFKTINSTQSFRAGWITQAFFGTNSFNIIVNNCHTDSLIGPNQQLAFICGRGFGQGNNTPNSSYCEITNCSVSGIISSLFGGGIVGVRTGQNGGVVNIINCFVTGNIGTINDSQIFGICGQQAGQNGGKVTINNCYSTGNILGRFSAGICGGFAGLDNGFISITNCYSLGNINGIYSAGIIGFQAGQQNGYVIVTNCYSAGDINGDYAGGISGVYFGYNSNNSNQIINCYSIGNINGFSSGGICGGDVGINDNTIYIPKVLIKNCYTLGNILNSSGAICGGSTGEVYRNIPIVNISNCYVLNGPIVSPSSQITPTQTLTYISPTNAWVDLEAVTYLLETPAYSPSGLLVNPIGTVWADIAPNSTSIPWIFSTLGYSPYTTKLVTTINQTVPTGGKSIKALDTTGPEYTIVSINDKVSTNFPKITMNKSTGRITFGDNIVPGIYLIKVYEQFNLLTQTDLTKGFGDIEYTQYTMTNFKSTIPERCTEYIIKIKKNTELIICLNKIFNGYFPNEKYCIVTNPSHGCAKIKSNSKLIYKPNKNYVGKDKFVLHLLKFKMPILNFNFIVKIYVL